MVHDSFVAPRVRRPTGLEPVIPLTRKTHADDNRAVATAELFMESCRSTGSPLVN